MEKYTEKRPWGGFEKFTQNEISTVKILTVSPNKRLSLQYHKKRHEFWRFLDNEAEVTLDDKKIRVTGGDEIAIPCGAVHRIQSFDKEVNVLEISFGEFDEDDIIRLEDDFKRI